MRSWASTEHSGRFGMEQVRLMVHTTTGGWSGMEQAVKVRGKCSFEMVQPVCGERNLIKFTEYQQFLTLTGPYDGLAV